MTTAVVARARAKARLALLNLDILRFDPKELRVAEGHVGGGRWRKLSDIVTEAVAKWDGKGENPLMQYQRPQLLTIAKGLGIKPRRGATEYELRDSIHAHLRGGDHNMPKPAEPVKAAKAAKKAVPARGRATLASRKSALEDLHAAGGQSSHPDANPATLDALEKEGLIRREGHVVHLTDAGRAELAKPAPRKAAPRKAPAAPSLADRDTPYLKDFYARAGYTEREKEIDRRVRDAFQRLQYRTDLPESPWISLSGPTAHALFRQNGHVAMADLRDELKDIPRAELDDVLLKMLRTGQSEPKMSDSWGTRPAVQFVQANARGSLLPRDNEASLEFGNQPHEWLQIADGALLGPPASPAATKAAVAKAAPSKRTPGAPAKAVTPELAASLESAKSEDDVIGVLSADQTLTSAKLRKVADELGIDVPADMRSKGAIQLHIAEQYARARGLSPSSPSPAVAKVAATPEPLSNDPERRAAQIDNRIRAAYTAHRQGPHGWATLAAMREDLKDLPRDEVDERLRVMNRGEGVTIQPEANQKTLTPADRDAAVVIGMTPKHAVQIKDPSPRPVPAERPGFTAPPASKAAAPRVARELSADPQTRAAQIRNRIRDAYSAELRGRNPRGSAVTLVHLRRHLGDLPRDEVDEQLRVMNRGKGDTAVVPETNRHLLTDEDHAAAVEIGGIPKHAISMRGLDHEPVPAERAPSRAVAKVAAAKKAAPTARPDLTGRTLSGSQLADLRAGDTVEYDGQQATVLANPADGVVRLDTGRNFKTYAPGDSLTVVRQAGSRAPAKKAAPRAASKAGPAVGAQVKLKSSTGSYATHGTVKSITGEGDSAVYEVDTIADDGRRRKEFLSRDQFTIAAAAPRAAKAPVDIPQRAAALRQLASEQAMHDALADMSAVDLKKLADELNMDFPPAVRSAAARRRYLARTLHEHNQRTSFRSRIGGLTDDVLRADNENIHTGAMIALVPSDADIQRLAVDGGEAPQDLHVTLLLLGDATDYDDDQRQELLDVAQSVADDLGDVVEADGFALSMFNPKGEDPCIVLGLTGEDLAAAYELTTDAVDETDLDIPDQHEPWAPHITVEYTDDPGKIKDLTDLTGPITLDRIRVAFGDEVHDFPLTPEAETPEEDAGETSEEPGDQTMMGRAIADYLRDGLSPEDAARAALEDDLARATSFSDTPWSQFTQADYDLQQWHDACLIHTNDGSDYTKADCKLPVREPDGTLNRNGIHAAAGRLHSVDASPEDKQATARKLVSLYRQMNDDPPAPLLDLAGVTRAQFDNDDEILRFTWDESKHPRGSKGSSNGGQFTSGKNSGSARQQADQHVTVYSDTGSGRKGAPLPAKKAAPDKRQPRPVTRRPTDHRPEAKPTGKPAGKPVGKSPVNTKRRKHGVIAPGTGTGIPGGDPDVRALQDALRKLGLSNRKTDGVLGRDTINAVKEAQHRLGVKPTGRVSVSLIHKMETAAKLSNCAQRSETLDPDDVLRAMSTANMPMAPHGHMSYMDAHDKPLDEVEFDGGTVCAYPDHVSVKVDGMERIRFDPDVARDVSDALNEMADAVEANPDETEPDADTDDVGRSADYYTDGPGRDEWLTSPTPWAILQDRLEPELGNLASIEMATRCVVDTYTGGTRG